MRQKTINLVEEFSNDPYGRYRSDGENNGTRFRNQYLLPALRDNDKVHVNLNGASYGSSFLDEAFACIIGLGYHDKNFLLGKMTLEHKLDTTIDRIYGYIDEQNFNSDPEKRARGEDDYPLPT